MVDPELKGKKIVVMGLGLHGGGVETARFLLGRGAEVVCTDLRTEAELRPSLDALKGLNIRYVLGRHDALDFDRADIIVKNPGVPSDSPLLAGRTNIETDISLFLKSCSSPVIAVTGTKGKSTVVSALYHIVKKEYPRARLGGNITVSPLSFVDDIQPEDPVVMELSSWQLGDIRSNTVFRPRIACITNLMWDHQNRYPRFADYEADKTVVFQNLGPGDWAVFPEDEYGRKWARSCAGTPVLIGTAPAPGPGASSNHHAWLDNENRCWYRGNNRTEELIPATLKVPGRPFRLNALFAGTIARLWGCDARTIREALSDFPGVAHRMERFLESEDLVFYDDTAATIPAATAAAVKALKRPVILIAGGTDKSLDFTPFDSVAAIPKRIVMLAGSATDAWLLRIREAGGSADGPYDDIGSAVDAAMAAAAPGDAILLSPGAASFGMFRHEFERGEAFKAACFARVPFRPHISKK